jgi:alkaline phosphatase D
MNESSTPGGLDRRSFLALGAVATGAAVLAPAAPALAGRTERASGSVFRLGVASGDPLPDSVILWTRLAPRPLELDGGMGRASATVKWEVASDESFANVVGRGSVEATAAFGYSVHVDVKGLTPDSWYYYRFKHGNEVSPVGRTRTTPELGAAMSRLRVGQTSCANWQSGFYQLYGDLAAQEPDYWLALGDYIYEYSGSPDNRYLRPSQKKPSRPIPWDSEPFSIAEYRRQYGLYRSDKHLQRLHATAPYSVIWDDHEVDNNFTSGKSGGDGQKDKGKFLARRAAGFQAFYENHAIRIEPPRPKPRQMRIYREITWGSLATFLMLDGRQYRSDQPGEDTPSDFGGWVDGMFDPEATMLGDSQELWLAERLRDSAARWNFIAQQTVMSNVNGGVGIPLLSKGLYNYDSWDGYWYARDRLVSAIKDGQVRNPVVLTGDFHCNLAFDLLDAWPDPRDFPNMIDQIAATKEWEATRVGTEIATGAISSPTFFEPGGPIPRPDIVGPATLEGTSWAQYGELLNNGYVLHDITPESDEALFRVCQANFKSTTPEGKPKDDKTVVIVDGVPGVSEVR